MKITVEIPEADLTDICRLTGIRKKGPAIRKVLDEALRFRRREEISQKFLSGEWAARLDGFEEARERDRASAKTLADQWRD